MQRVDTLNTGFHAIQTPAYAASSRGTITAIRATPTPFYGERFGAHAVTCVAFGPGVSR